MPKGSAPVTLGPIHMPMWRGNQGLCYSKTSENVCLHYWGDSDLDKQKSFKGKDPIFEVKINKVYKSTYYNL